MESTQTFSCNMENRHLLIFFLLSGQCEVSQHQQTSASLYFALCKFTCFRLMECYLGFALNISWCTWVCVITVQMMINYFGNMFCHITFKSALNRGHEITEVFKFTLKVNKKISQRFPPFFFIWNHFPSCSYLFFTSLAYRDHTVEVFLFYVFVLSVKNILKEDFLNVSILMGGGVGRRVGKEAHFFLEFQNIAPTFILYKSPSSWILQGAIRIKKEGTSQLESF